MTTGQKNGMTIGLKRVVHLNAHDMHEINARFCEVYYMSRLSVILGQVRTGKVLSGMVVVVPWSRVVGHDLAMTHTVVEHLRIWHRLEPELLHPSYLSITIRNHAFPYRSHYHSNAFMDGIMKRELRETITRSVKKTNNLF